MSDNLMEKVSAFGERLKISGWSEDECWDDLNEFQDEGAIPRPKSGG